MIYSVVAGIWGFAPVEKMNAKIFGTAVIIVAVFAIILYTIQDGKSERDKNER
jgi:hypothetical protein